MPIYIHTDFSEAYDEIDRLTKAPSRTGKKALNAVLEFGFRETQASVHVDTTSLKGSGTKKSDYDRTTATWEGEIKYGGPTSGPKNPVDYAIYEKRRGGDHDFMAKLRNLHPMFVAALLKVMSK